MELLADENIDRPIVEKLRARGFDVLAVDEEMKGASDREVLERAEEEERIIVAFDRDFVDADLEDAGVLHITSVASYDRVVEAVTDVLRHVDREDIRGETIQVTPANL